MSQSSGYKLNRSDYGVNKYAVNNYAVNDYGTTSSNGYTIERGGETSPSVGGQQGHGLGLNDPGSQGEEIIENNVQSDIEPMPEEVPEEVPMDIPGLIPSRKERVRRQWQERVKANTTLPTVPLHSEYRGEETNQQSAKLETSIAKREMTGTHYASSPSEFGTDVVHGRLQRGGETVDSTNNRRIYSKDRNGRSNFALDGAGGFYSSDVRTEIDKHLGETEGKRHNHSSLVAGGEVAAAGTMAVEDGKVTSLSDESGHYRPDMTQTYEAVKHLRDRKVMGEKAKVELSEKNEGEGMFTSTVEEFMRYEDLIHQSREGAKEMNFPGYKNRPEQALRKELGARRGLEAQLRNPRLLRRLEEKSSGGKRMNKINALEERQQQKRQELNAEMFWNERLSSEVPEAVQEDDGIAQGEHQELPELQLDLGEEQQPLELLELQAEQLELEDLEPEGLDEVDDQDDFDDEHDQHDPEAFNRYAIAGDNPYLINGGDR